MHSKRRRKICICSVILGGTLVFSKLQGLQYHFSEILHAIQRITKVRIFLIRLSTTYLNPKILAFLFVTKNSLALDVK